MGYALVTGASRGIGREIARELAVRKTDLFITSRNESELISLKQELESKHGIKVEVFAYDLSLPDAAEKISSRIKALNIPVKYLINNAGYGLWGDFDALSLEDQNNMMRLNMDLPVMLSHMMIPELKKNTPSYILNVASTAAYQAVPTLSVYSATKAFIINFTRGLRHELKSSGISVSCLSPGGTKTGFIERGGMHHLEKASEKLSMMPQDVAKAGVKGMLAGKAEIIPGFLNIFSVSLIPFLPKSIIEKAAHNIYRLKK